MRILHSSALVLLSIALSVAACGGDNGDDPSRSEGPPAGGTETTPPGGGGGGTGVDALTRFCPDECDQRDTCYGYETGVTRASCIEECTTELSTYYTGAPANCITAEVAGYECILPLDCADLLQVDSMAPGNPCEAEVAASLDACSAHLAGVGQ